MDVLVSFLSVSCLFCTVDVLVSFLSLIMHSRRDKHTAEESLVVSAQQIFLHSRYFCTADTSAQQIYFSMCGAGLKIGLSAGTRP